MCSLKKITIPVASAVLNGNEKKYVNECLDTGWISSNGEFVERFEREFAAFSKTEYSVSCCNGTVSLHLALLAHKVGTGDEIIMPTLTYVATANTVKYCGATPVFIDSEEETWNVNPDLIEEKITKKTKGIVVVHLYGHPVDMDPILKIAKKHSLFIIEDAAEAHGALYKGKIVGSIGDCGSFSFYGNKIITTGEGGMVVTNSKSLADTIRTLKGQGVDPNRRYWHPVIGYNYRMTNIEAAIGLAQLEKIGWHLQRRREIAVLYKKYLCGYEQFIKLPVEMNWAKHAFWMYSILLKDNVKITRNEFMNKLQEAGIETRPVFYPMHLMPPYREPSSHYPVAEKIAERGINLPTHGNLSENEIIFIAKTIGSILQSM
jgi:perosamine synthetase